MILFVRSRSDIRCHSHGTSPLGGASEHVIFDLEVTVVTFRPAIAKSANFPYRIIHHIDVFDEVVEYSSLNILFGLKFCQQAALVMHQKKAETPKLNSKVVLDVFLGESCMIPLYTPTVLGYMFV